MEGGGDAMMAPAAGLINSAPDYDLKLGVYTAIVRSHEWVKAIPPTPAQLSVTAMVRSAGAATAGETVDYFVKRFLRLPLDSAERDGIVAFLEGKVGGEALNYRSPTIERDSAGDAAFGDEYAGVSVGLRGDKLQSMRVIEAVGATRFPPTAAGMTVRGVAAGTMGRSRWQN